MTRTTRTRRATRGSALALAGLLTLGLGLTACGDDADSSDTTAQDAASTTDGGSAITVGDPWVRATAGTDDPSMTAAFMTLDNGGDDDITLVSASSPVAGMVQLHEMSMDDDGGMVMQEVDGGITITAGRGKVLEPGGYHVMLMDMQQDLSPGDEVELTLEFSDGSTQTLTAPVKEFTEEEGHYHEDGTEHDHSDMSDMSEMETESSDS